MKDTQKKTNSSKKTLPKYDSVIIPIILTIILGIAVFLSLYERGKHFILSMNSLSAKTYESVKTPVLKNKYDPNVTAHASVIMDKETKAVLYAKNKDFRFSPASTTKIMTALVALEYFKPFDILTVKNVVRDGSILGMYEGQGFTFENLLYAMMLPSANDAAFVIAQNYPGGTDGFIKKMNEKAEELNLPNTQFGDPAGLLDKKDYTTAVELARLTTYALDNKLFAKVVSTPEKIIYDTNGNSYIVDNRNKLLGVNGVNGVKTGTTEEAGNVLVTSKNIKDRTIVTIVLRSEDRFADTMKLLDMVDGENLTYLTIRP